MLYKRINNNFIEKNENTTKFYINNIHVGVLKQSVAKLLSQELKFDFTLKENKLYLNQQNASFNEVSNIFCKNIAKIQQIGLIDKIRNEDFFIRSYNCNNILGKIDRSLVPVLGIPAFGIHINCINQDGKIWVAKRSANTFTHPNKLDNLVGGGINADNNILTTLYKEAFEEAGIKQDIAKKAQFAEILHYQSYNQNKNQIRNDYLYVFDLKLQNSFTPISQDNENQSFLLLKPSEVIKIIQDKDDFKFNSELVVLSYMLRNQHLKDNKALEMVEQMVI